MTPEERLRAFMVRLREENSLNMVFLDTYYTKGVSDEEYKEAMLTLADDIETLLGDFNA